MVAGIAVLVFASVVAWAVVKHTGNVAEVERCEASGGTAVLAARAGYVCLGGGA